MLTTLKIDITFFVATNIHMPNFRSKNRPRILSTLLECTTFSNLSTNKT